MKAWIASLLFLFGCSCSGIPQQVTIPIESGVEDALNATVALVTASGRTYCAGVVHHGFVLTAAHCVVGHKDGLHVGFREGLNSDLFFDPTYKYQVAYLDEEQDIAVLANLEETPAHPTVTLPLGDPYQGDPVVLIGHPLGLPYSMSTGVIAAYRRQEEPYGRMVWMQVDAAVAPGNSGGPVFSRYGELLGLVSFHMTSGDRAYPNIAGCVHLDTIRAAMATLEPTTP